MTTPPPPPSATYIGSTRIKSKQTSPTHKYQKQLLVPLWADKHSSPTLRQTLIGEDVLEDIVIAKMSQDMKLQITQYLKLCLTIKVQLIVCCIFWLLVIVQLQLKDTKLNII